MATAFPYFFEITAQKRSHGKNNCILSIKFVLYYEKYAPGGQTRASLFVRYFIVLQAFSLDFSDTGLKKGRWLPACYAIV